MSLAGGVAAGVGVGDEVCARMAEQPEPTTTSAMTNLNVKVFVAFMCAHITRRERTIKVSFVPRLARLRPLCDY